MARNIVLDILQIKTVSGMIMNAMQVLRQFANGLPLKVSWKSELSLLQHIVDALFLVLVSMPEMLNCPTGYVSWYGYCYSIVTTLLNFFEAHDNCNAIGGELAAIESVEQNRWLFELLRTKGLAGRDVYIGLHDIDQEGAFQWLDHEIASRDFDFDHPHQPDNLDNSEHCVGFWSNFPFPKWNDMNCDSRAASICRWRPNRSKCSTKVITFIVVLIVCLLQKLFFQPIHVLKALCGGR